MYVYIYTYIVWHFICQGKYSDILPDIWSGTLLDIWCSVWHLGRAEWLCRGPASWRCGKEAGKEAGRRREEGGHDYNRLKYRRLSIGIIRIMPFLALKSKLLNPRQRLLIPKSFYNLTYTGHYIPYLYCRIGNHWPQVIHSPPISSKELGTSKRTTSPKSYILVKSKESIIFCVYIKVYKCVFSSVQLK